LRSLDGRTSGTSCSVDDSGEAALEFLNMV
jgi:hypothetical protein